MAFNDDNYSLYSFESVSTNGRLLDRLDLNEIDEETEEGSSPSQSNQFPQHTGPYSSSNSYLPHRQSNIPPRQTPIRSNSLPNRSIAGHTKSHYTPMKIQGNIIPPGNSINSSTKVTTGQLQKKVVYENNNRSIVSLKAGLSNPSSDTLLSIPSWKTLSDSSLPNVITPTTSLTPSLLESSSTRNRANTTGTDSTIIAPSDEQSGESRTRVALQYRNIGKHREASYQLQIAANPPYNYPKAMYLYAMALRFGLGVQQSGRQYLKWICKCILMYSDTPVMTDIVDQLNRLQPEELMKLIIQRLEFDNKKDPGQKDPLHIYSAFSSLSKAEIAKIATTCKSKSDILAVAHYELGNALIHGWGLNRKDELTGMQLLTKSAAMGYIDAMIQLGEMYSSKSKNRKKDLYAAAAWLRVSEIFGVKSIGNSWIYKDKYMAANKS